MLLLLLLPVRLDRVLREVLHELERLLDLEQHFISLTASHLRGSRKTEKMRSCRGADGQPTLIVGGFCVVKCTSSRIHICNMSVNGAGTFRSVVATQAESSANCMFPADGEQGEVLPLFQLSCLELIFFFS